ncbi:hypothetical protein [Erythrobacter sp. WG]|uniref:hypothetical protein n=1 Tax=Erythrobacter sp. WG TaxID=2985510 RepID=UPI0022716C01|nr:hypothetical protein [Erythrobacter sp. WG]MCX9147990.1 hypothetical protein [Erythrobacter sp. WG]
MREPEAETFRKPREDVVVSVCFSELAASAGTFAALRDLAGKLDTAYRFREIILVVDDSQREAFLPLVREIANTRLFVVRRGTEYYDRRVIAAEEAIGDLVILGNLDEIAALDVLRFLDFAEAENAVTMAFRPARRPIKRMLAWPFIALGKLAGFNVDPAEFQSIAVPRTLLNLMLAHDEPRLALRFPPRDPRLPREWFRTGVNVPSRTAFMGVGRRLALLQTLLVYLTPTILSVVAISSSILALVGLAYAAWVVGALLLVETLAPGWLTTNAMLAVSAIFMGFSTLGLSLGLQHLLKQQRRAKGGIVPEEVNRIDLFQQVAFDLNVVLESDPAAAPLPPREG